MQTNSLVTFMTLVFLGASVKQFIVQRQTKVSILYRDTYAYLETVDVG